MSIDTIIGVAVIVFLILSPWIAVFAALVLIKHMENKEEQ